MNSHDKHSGKLEEVKINLKDKEFEWTLEFVKRVIERNIIDLFGNDLSKCKNEIKRVMEEKSVIVYSPDEKYYNQHWCLIELPSLGLTKIPIAILHNKIVVITIANPVTDQRCNDVYNDKFKKR